MSKITTSRLVTIYSRHPSTSSVASAVATVAVIIALLSSSHNNKNNCAVAAAASFQGLSSTTSFSRILVEPATPATTSAELSHSSNIVIKGGRKGLFPWHFMRTNKHYNLMSERCNENNMDEHPGQEIGKRPLCTTRDARAQAQAQAQAQDDTDNFDHGHGEGDDASEDNSPRRGRPGIVVFSGGTAFNAASADMASRSVVMDHNVGLGNNWNDNEDEVEGISRSNSVSNFVDLLAMGSMETVASSRSIIHQSNIAPGGGLKVWHVLPVTDDGGSTAEIVRVLGGPAVGDIRSRLLRLAPGTTREARAVRRLLGHRLINRQSLDERQQNGDEVTNDMVSRMAREEWLDILDGGQYQTSSEHPLWKDVSDPYRSVRVLRL